MRKFYPVIKKSRLLIALFCILFGSFTDVVFAQSQIFNSSGTFVVPAGVTSVRIEAWGGGAGGDNGNNRGGGGGAFAGNNTLAVTPGNSITVTVGTGGAAAARGNNSSFGASVVAMGGGNGSSNLPGGTVAGSTGAAGLVFAGGNGGTSSSNGGGGGGGSAGAGGAGGNGANSSSNTGAIGGTAGAAGAGSAGAAGGTGGNSTTSGNPGGIPGAGGGENGASGGGSGSGANGRVIVYWTCPTYSLTSVASTTICQSASSTITLTSSAAALPVGIYSVTYNLTGSNTATGTVVSMTVATAGTGTFSTSALANSGATTITITNLSSGSTPCSNTISTGNSTGITINANPTVNVGGAVAAICQGGTTTALSGSFGGSATAAIWSDGAAGGTFANNSGTTPGTATYTAAAGAPTTVTLTLTTSGGSCSTTSAGKSLTVNKTPTVNVGGAIAAICQNATSASLGGSFGGGATGAVWSDGGASGTFTNNGGSTPGTATYKASLTAPATVTLTLTSTGGSCGTTFLTKTITVNPLPTVAVGSALAAVCQGGSTVALGGSFGGGATGAIWSDGGAGGTFTDNTGSTPGITIYTASATAPATVTLTLTTNGGACSTTSLGKSLTVNKNPTVNVGGATAAICQNATSVALGGSFGGGATGAIWSDGGAGGTFTNNGGTTAGSATYKAASNAPSTVTLTLTSTGGSCGTTFLTKTITVNPLPTVAAGSALAAICQGGTTAALDGSFGGGATGAIWSDGGAGGVFANNGGSTPGAATYTASATAPATITLTLTTNGGSCSTVANTKSLSINPLPTATISGTTSVCENDGSPNITFTGVIGTAPFTFIYKINGGADQSVTSVSGNSITVAAPTTVTGVFNYSLRSVSDANTCSQAQAGSAIITVNEPVVITTEPNPSQTICNSLPATFTVAATGDIMGYQWYLGSTPLTDNSNINGSQTATLTLDQVASTDAGLYHVVITGMPTCSPVTSADAELIVNQNIVISVQPAPQVVCVGDVATFSVTSSGTGLTYEWKKGVTIFSDDAKYSGATTSSLSISGITAADAGSYKVSISDGSAGCPNTNSTAALLTVNATSVGGTVNTSATVCSGTSGTLTLAGKTGNVVNWESSTDGGGTWTPIANTSTSLPYTNITQTTSFRAVVKNGVCAAVNSTEAIVTVSEIPTVSLAGANQVICSTSASTLLTANIPVNGIGVWAVTSGPSTSLSQFSDINSATATFSPAGGAGTYILQWTISNSPCASSSSSVNIVLNTAPSISGQPVPQVACAGTTKTFSITAAGTSPTFQWQYSTDDASWSNVTNGTPANITYANSTTATLTATPAAASANGTYYYRCVVNVNGCSALNSSSATFTVSATPTVSNAGSAQTICTSSASTTLAANTPVNGIGTWSVVSGPSTSVAQFSDVNAPAASFSPAGGAGTYVIRWTISNGPCTTSGSNVNIVVNTAPSISSQPAPQTTCVGTAKTFSVTAAGTAPTYQWQFSADNATWSNVTNGTPANITYTNATTATLTVTPAAAATNGTYYYRCVVSVNGCSVLNSNSATLVVSATVTASNAGTAQTICTITTSTTLAGNTPVNGIGTWSVTSGPSTSVAQFSDVNAPAATFSPAGGAGTYVLRWTISNGPCATSGSNVNILVNTAPSISSQPAAQAACAGTAKTFSVTAAGTSPTYQWQYSIDNISWSNVANGTPANITYTNNTTATLTVTPATTAANGTYYYRCVVSVNGCSVLNSNAATLTLSATPTASNAGADQTICTTASGTTLAANTPANGIGTWSVVSGPSTSAAQFSNINSATATFSPAAGAGTYVVRWTISNGTCTTSANDANIVVNAAPTISSQPAPQITCAGTLKTFSITAAGTSPTYQWQYSIDNTTWSTVANGTPANITYSGTTTNTLTATPATATSNGTYYYRCVVSVNNCASLSSSSATLTVYARPTTANAGSDQTLCTTTTNTTLAANTAANGTGTWSVTGPSAATSQFSNLNSPTATFTPAGGAGTYSLVWTISNGTCTSSTDGITIVVNTPPSISGQPANQVTCAGTGKTFSVTASGSSLTYQWQYSPNGSTWSNVANGTPANINYNNSTSATMTATPSGAAAAGLYYYRSVVTVAGCSVLNSNAATLTVNINSTISLSSAVNTDNQEICLTQPITNITYAIGGGGTGASITAGALPAGVTGSFSGGVFSIVGTPSVAGTFNYTVTTAGPCTQASKTGTIVVKAIPAGTLTATETSGTANNDNTICAGSSVTFTATSGFGSYIFKVNGSQVQAGTSNIWNSSTLTNGASVTVDVSNALNCGATFGPVVITVNPLPATILTADMTTICKGDTITFTATGGSSYSFKVNGSAVQISASGTYQANDLNNGDIVTVEASNANGCIATSALKTITVNPLPAGTLVASATEICSGGPVTFTASTGYNSYEFFVDGVSAQSGASRIYNTSFTSPSIVTVKVTNTTTGCSKFWDTLAVNVNTLPSGILTAMENSGVADDNSICAGTPVNFTATVGFVTYQFMVNGVSKQVGSANTYSNSSLSDNDITTVKVSSGTGCEATFAGVQINVAPSPTGSLSVSPSATICAGDDVTFTATGGYTNYTFKIGTNVEQNGPSNTFTTSALVNGNVVTVEVTNANTCITTFNPITLTVNALPTATLVAVENSGVAANDNITCAGAAIIFTAPAGFSDYNFLLNGISVQDGTSRTFTRSNLGTGDKVEVAVSNANNCIALSNAIVLTVNPIPPVSPITGTLSVCVGNTTTLADATASGVWSSLNTGIATVDASGIVTGVTPGSATIHYTVSSASGCDSTVSATVVVNPLPTVAAISGPAGVCEGSTINLTDAIPGGSWSSSDDLVATVSATGTVSGVQTGTVTITYSVTNANGCTKNSTKLITVNVIPVLTSITGTTGLCVNTTSTLSSTPVGGVWTSNNKPVATVNAATGVVTAVSAGTTTITYTVTSGSGCIASVSTTVTVNPLPVPTLTGKNPICLNDNEKYVTEAGQTAYVWHVVGGTITGGGTSADDTIQVTWTAAGAKSITVNYTNSFGCTAATSSSFTNAPTTTPPSFVSGVNAACVNTTGNVYSTQPGHSDYTWTVTGGTIESGGTDVDDAVTVTWTTTGTKSVSINYSDAFGCNAVSATVYPVTVNPLPTATISGTVTVCQGTTSPEIIFTGAHGTSPYTFTYTLNGGAPQTIVSTDDFATIAVSTSAAGAFTYSLVSVKDASSTTCSQAQTGTATVTVSTTPSATIAYAGGPFCTTAAPVSVIQTGTPGGTYSATGGLTIDVSTGTITPATSTGGLYIVTYTVAAVGGCSTYTTTTNVNITTAPSATISYNGGPFCTSTTPVTVTRTGTAGGNYTATTGLTIDASTGTITPATSSNGTYTVTYTIPASGGCALFSTTATVTITSAPTATISYTGSPFCSNAAAVSVSRTGTAGGTYSSAAGLSLDASTGTITPGTSAGGTYTITYSIGGTGGCANFTTTTSVTITAAPTAVAGTAIPTCANTGAVNITAGSSATNTSGVLWTSNGTGTFANATSLTNATYTPSAADIAAGSRTLTLTANGNAGCGAATSTKTITISAVPAAFFVTPASAALCLGDIQSLIATGSAPNTGSVTISSGNFNVAIPDASNSGNPGKVTNNMTVAGIPAGAVINSMSINFNVNHTYDQDLVLNLKGPNGNVLNLVDNRGGSQNNFTNTTISSAATVPVNAAAAPFTGTYTADAHNNQGNPTSNVNSFALLTGTPGPNGTWTFGAQDERNNDIGTIVSWSLTFNYTVPVTPLAVVWTPATALYTDPGATIAYGGQALSTVYSKPATTGAFPYTATMTNGAGCSSTQTTSITVNAVPSVTISSDYCIVPGKVRLTATSVPAATSYLWSNGATTQSTDVDIAGTFDVTAFGATSCPGKATINVANELVTNGDFEAGNVGFTTLLPYKTAAGSLNSPPGYAVDTAANRYGPTFLWGKDHTTGHGKFMMVNGSSTTIWQETVTVQPNTTYYFSAWGLELDNLPSPPTPANANLQFNVNGAQTGTIGILPRPNNPTKDQDNNGWVRFYGSWTSGPTTTSAVITITDLQNAVYGNNFGLDDISFGTLSTFITLVSAPGTDAQTVCKSAPITDIRYNVGNGGASGPTVTGLPAGITSTYSGDLTISGTPTAPGGTYTYTITTTGTCNPSSATGTITVQAPTISLSAGSTSPSVCMNSPVNIGFTIGGTATGATVTGLPSGVTGTFSGTTYTISGSSALGGSYPYTITTTGTCSPQTTISGTITVQSQTVTLNTIPSTSTQTVCINTPLTTIRYAVGGTANNATVSGLPAGVTGTFSGGFLNITGSPTSAAGSPYTYTVTTSGSSCDAASITGTITITPAATLILTSATGTNAQNACNNLAITPITYSVNGGTSASITSGAFPAGVSGSYSGGVYTISGVPAAGGVFNYTITTTGGCGSSTATGSITVSAQTITLTSGLASPSLCANTLMPNIVYTIGGTATGASVSGLPAGVTGSLSGNIFTISGTPTGASGPYAYTVTTSGTCDPKTASGTITIQPGATGGSLTGLFVCSNTSGTLTLSGQSGTIQRWELSTNNGSTWSPVTNTTITQAYSSLAVPTQYRVVVGNGCGNVFSSVANIGIHNYWTGTVSDVWSNGANWSDGAVPTMACADVVIPAGTPFSPVLATGIASINNLIIKPTATLTVTGATLQIAGTITSTAGLNATSGTLTFNGAATQTISGSVLTGNSLMNLTLSNTSGLTVPGGAGNTVNISGVLGFGTVNNATVHTGDNIVLTSTATGTARVGDITNNGANTGNKFDGIVTVERYFPARRAWRLFTAPVSAGGAIFNNWQNGGVYQPGTGTYVSGAPATSPTGPNGLDWSPLNNSSLKSTVALSPVLNTHTTLLSRNVADTSDNIPYFIFVRGDRDPANTNIYNSNPTTLSSRGKLQTGRQTFPANTTALGYTFIGNPYASPVDLNKIVRNNVGNRFWVWDPYLNAEQGAWVVFDDPLNTGTYSHTATYDLKQQLQSGQAFFVMTDNNGPASVIFQETAKSSVNNLSTFRPLGQLPSLRVNLYHLNADNKTVLLDGILTQFDNSFNKGVDLQDADKAYNVKEMLALKTDGKSLAIERRPVPVADDTLHLALTKTSQRNYRFQIEPLNLDPLLTAFLEDRYTGTKTPLSITASSVQDFAINADTASAAADRFRIVFKKIQPLPVMHTRLTAYQLSSNIAVEWKVENERNIDTYEVEKSADGINFTKVNTTAATGANLNSIAYSWLDVNPLTGDNFYRIRQIGPDGKFEYSDLVSVKIANVSSGIRIYPNPVTNGIIGAEFKSMEAGVYTTKLLNSAGQVVLNGTINHAAGNAMEYIKPGFHLSAGIYQLEVTSPDKKSTKVKVIIK